MSIQMRPSRSWTVIGSIAPEWLWPPGRHVQLGRVVVPGPATVIRVANLGKALSAGPGEVALADQDQQSTAVELDHVPERPAVLVSVVHPPGPFPGLPGVT